MWQLAVDVTLEKIEVNQHLWARRTTETGIFRSFFPVTSLSKKLPDWQPGSNCLSYSFENKLTCRLSWQGLVVKNEP